MPLGSFEYVNINTLERNLYALPRGKTLSLEEALMKHFNVISGRMKW